MSITTEIQRLRTNVNKVRQDTSDILDAIANKGVTVPAGSNLDDCAGLVSQISGVPTEHYVGRYYFESTNSAAPYLDLENMLVIGASGGYLNGAVPENVTGKDVEINLTSLIAQPNSIIAIIGVQTSPNYGFYAIHYDETQHKIWIGAPNAAGTGWQTSDWYSYTLSYNVYHTFNLKYTASTQNFVLTIDGTQIASTTLSETPTIGQQKFAFGHNYDGNYRCAQTIKLANTYCMVNGVLVFGNKTE